MKKKKRGVIMHARMTTVAIQPGKMEEALNLIESEVIPAAEKQQGFDHFYTLVNGNNAVCVSIWDSEAAMVAGEASDYYQAQVAKVSHTFADKPTLRHYEVKT
jgi:heme-degrading monooxygenase HmoA